MSENTDGDGGGGATGGDSSKGQMVPLRRLAAKEEENQQLAARVTELEGQLRRASASSLANEHLSKETDKYKAAAKDATDKLAQREAWYSQELALVGLGIDDEDARDLVRLKHGKLGDAAPPFGDYIEKMKADPPAWLKPWVVKEAEQSAEEKAAAEAAVAGASGNGTGGADVQDITDGEGRVLPGNEGTAGKVGGRPYSELNHDTIKAMSDNPEQWEKHKAGIMKDIGSF